MDFGQGSSRKAPIIALEVICLALCLSLVTGSVSAQQPKAPVQANQLQQLLKTGQSYFEQGRFDDALKVYSQVIGLSMKDPTTVATANLRIGSIYLAQRKPVDAVASFQRAV